MSSTEVFNYNNTNIIEETPLLPQEKELSEDTLFSEKLSHYLNSEEFKKNLLEFHPKSRQKIIGAVIEYNVLHKDFFELDKFWDSLRTLEGKSEYSFDEDFRSLLVESVKDKLGLLGPLKIEDEEKVYTYVLENFILNGYYFHGFNGVFEEAIKKNGLSPMERLWDLSELQEISAIGAKHNNKMILGWHSLNSESSFFINFHAGSAYRYATVSPEWFAQLAGEGTFITYKKNGNKHAFARRDYGVAKENVEGLCSTMKVDESEREKILSFFDKYWNILTTDKATPKLALIKTQAVFPKEKLMRRYDEGLKSFMEFKQKYKLDEPREEVINDLFRFARLGHDQAVKKKIAPENILMIDMPAYSEVYPAHEPVSLKDE